MSASDESANGELPAEAAGEAARREEPGLLAELLERPETTPTRPALLRAPLVGRFCTWDPARGPLVDFEDNPGGPVPARSAIPLDAELVREAAASGRGVLLTFEAGRPERPIVTGLLHELPLTPEPVEPVELPQPEDELELGLELGQGEEEGETEDEGEGDALEARIDGRRVELEAADEIVLRCGKASIVLRRNGRVVIRGTYVETRSRGVNRIKGGSVEIN